MPAELMQTLSAMPAFPRHLLLTMGSMTFWLFLLTIIFVPLERAFAVNRQPTWRRQIPADLGYFFMTGLIPSLVLAMPLGGIAALSRHVLPQAYFLWIIELPIGIQIAAAFVIGELGFYWGHRIMHQVPWLWRFHAVHHEPVRMDWLINTRAHPVDIIFTRMCGLTLVYIAGFGTPQSGPDNLIPTLVLIIGTFWGFFIHSNLKACLGWFEQILSSPRFHHWHHSRVDHVNHNYASTLTFYDRLFGSHYLPPRAWPPSYGIAPENRPDVLIAAQYADRPTEDLPPTEAKDAA